MPALNRPRSVSAAQAQGQGRVSDTQVEQPTGSTTPTDPPQVPGAFPLNHDRLNQSINAFRQEREQGHDTGPITPERWNEWVRQDPQEVYKFCAEMFDKEFGKRRRREELIRDLQQQLQASDDERLLLKEELRQAKIRLEARAPPTELREVRQQLEQAHQEIDVNERQVQARDQEIAQLKERLRAASLLSNASGGSNVVPTPKP
ncbi:hypothetical protein KEM56_005699, partial [Ascosphaera pollenicola]